ncbi:unnamed protein product [Brassicogethes aeneus]|uniref:Uncharacterized protein n=1 Tax=Brassicogethes aeneus TaxID=1431903 RepID=A0A9P0AUM1_BRAAE|nr:unnamed protein product [Brassicogethes aeneus]
MARNKKLTEVEAKLKKKEYDRKRREKTKGCAKTLEKLREKERLKYLLKKEKGQVKLVGDMNSREKRQKRKQWKLNSSVYRIKKANLRKNLRLLDETPPASLAPFAEPSIQNNSVNRDAIAMRRRRLLRNRRAIMYAKIANLEIKLKEEVKRREKYRKRCVRMNKQNKTYSPEAKVTKLLKNIKVPEIVKKKLLFSELLTKELTQSYNRIKTHKGKQEYYKNLKLDLLKKRRLLHLSKPFFKNQNYKKRNCRKVKSKMLTVKQDIINFLEKDENSRMCPGKRDFVRLGKLVKQKRLLTDNMRNLHKQFLISVTYKISLSTFCRFRPFWVTWANIKERDTCKCVVHANMELIVSKLHEHKALLHNNIPRLLTAITCDIYCAKCLFRECVTCKNKTIQYFLPLPDKVVIYKQWMYQSSTYENNGKMKTVRKPIKKEITISLKKLVSILEDTLQSFLIHAGNIAHQYQTIAQLKKNLSENDVLIHIDFSENYSCKYGEEIQAVHFGGGRQQVTLHTGVLYLRDLNNIVKAQSFCTLSGNNRHDSMAVWAHLKPIFDWLKDKRPNIHTVHLLSDSPVNQYKNKFMFHVVFHHLRYFFPGITYFSWNYSEPGHGKGAPDGVGGTLKRSADQAVAEGKDITDLTVLKDVLVSKCPSIMLIEITTAEIDKTDNLVKESGPVSTFRGTQKIRQFVFLDGMLEFRTLSCFDCVRKCQHFHLGYYKARKTLDKNITSVAMRLQKANSRAQILKNDLPAKDIFVYKVGDHVLVRWDSNVYPGEILSVCNDGALIRCMIKASKCWKWPAMKNEQLYAWHDVLQIIEPPKMLKKGCYFVEKIDKQ